MQQVINLGGSICHITTLTGLNNCFQCNCAVRAGTLVYRAVHMLTEDQQERPLRSLEMEGADGSRTVPASATMSLDLRQ